MKTIGIELMENISDLLWDIALFIWMFLRVHDQSRSEFLEKVGLLVCLDVYVIQYRMRILLFGDIDKFIELMEQKSPIPSQR